MKKVVLVLTVVLATSWAYSNEKLENSNKKEKSDKKSTLDSKRKSIYSGPSVHKRLYPSKEQK